MEESKQVPQNTNKNTIIVIIVVIAVLIVGIFVTKGTSNTEVMVTPSQAPSEDVVTQVTVIPSGSTGSSDPEAINDVLIVEIEAGSFYYKPNEIKVKKGQKVQIVISSVSMMHDFVIDELGVKLPIVKNGETGTVEFVADQVGEFEYYCSVGQHRAQGQVGTLVVEE